MSVFKITTEKFEGPIDALLQLIEKRKLPINDISLAEITDDYIRFIQTLSEQSISNKTHFIFVASTLTLIKSKSLLPTLELTQEEEGDIEELKRRIAILKQFQDTALELKSMMSPQRNFSYPKTRKKEIFFQPHSDINTVNLHTAVLAVFKEVPEKKQTKKEGYVKIAVHIEEMMYSLEERLTQAIKTDFQSYISSYTDSLTEHRQVRVYRVVGFLAMLELVKKGALHVLQEENFSNIQIEQI